ncbi:D-glycero-D-manno-heptose 1-phosphate guanosyltransferase [Emticicia sediminis]
MDVIILAGGLGMRLRKVINELPKPMAPIKNKPFLEHLLNWVSLYPISNIILATGYKSEVIETYFGNSFKGIPIVYSIESSPLGTGGAIIKAFQYCKSEKALVLNGDSYFPIDLIKIKSFSELYQAKFVVALKKMYDFERYGSVEINRENNKIIKFQEKSFCKEGLINGGIYLIEKSFWDDKSYIEKFSFEKEVLEVEASKGNLNGQVFDVPFIDIGIPEDYKKAAEYLLG